MHNISSVESQKGVIADQRCSVENQKGAIAIDFVQQQCPSGSQLTIFEKYDHNLWGPWAAAQSAVS